MSALALQAAIAAGQLNGSDLKFAQSLLSKKHPTPKVLYWIDELAKRAARPPRAPAATADLGSAVGGIFTLFVNASANGLKWPKIHLTASDGTAVVLNRAGERSRYCGQVQITDGGRYGDNRYFGRVDTSGTMTEGRDITQPVRELVLEFAADPAGIAAAYGKRTGACCFCSRHLETDESLAVGYGPICADKFGLPWGE